MAMPTLRSMPARNVFRIRLIPEFATLETRLALSIARPTLQAAGAAAADVIAIRGSLVAGTLDIQGTSGADTVAIGRSARGFVTVTIDGEVRSGDLRDRDAFDRRLLGLRVDRLRAVRLTGDDPLDTVVLNTMLGTSARPARIQSNAVTIAAPLIQAGTLRIEARSITVSADVRADAIVIAAAGLLNLEAGGSLTASKSIELKADRLIQTGNLAAPAVSMAANVLMRSGTIAATGGSVDLQFTENYVATQNATIDVSGPESGGSIRIDGGTTGHLFNSGTLLSKGKNTGGEIRISGKDVVWIGGGADVSGGSSGGFIHVGGGWQGSDASMTKARTLKVSSHTSLKADGGSQGGTVVLWSEEETANYGTVSATGAKGGAVEVSSKASLAHGGAVDVGPGGRFLLDPKNIVIADNVMGGVPMFELVNPTPNVNDSFGTAIVPLSTGNVVVTDPGDNAVATGAGAVYLYNGATGVLISALTGSTEGDGVGGVGVTVLTNGNYLVQSSAWDNGAATDAGAVTWGSGTTGVNGLVSASISLVGSTTGDYVGSGGVTVLSNGNYVVRTTGWDNGAAIDAGAVTWGSGTTGVAGVVSASNSLVGSTGFENVGNGGITALPNGNYVVSSYFWNLDRGAVTWGSGTTGVAGAISAANSLVGSQFGDYVGRNGVTVLSNGNYVVRSVTWDNGAVVNAGAVTWGSGAAGVAGVVSAANSLVGSTGNDQVGNFGVTALPNGNYLVSSLSWSTGVAAEAGAVTWGSGTTGVAGVVSAANSLVGSRSEDQVGNAGVTVLSNGNYVVSSPRWDNGAVANAGAVTWGSGTAGVAGAVSASNSLVGSTANEIIGNYGVTALTNGNYVVKNPAWNINAGAVTWGLGTAGVVGAVSAANSLVGSSGDYVGIFGVIPLANGNYVVNSPYWNNGAATEAGAITWGSGTAALVGVVSAANSLVGSTAFDNVGYFGVSPLDNGNYVVNSPYWNNGAATDAGAVTWGSGTTGVVGVVSAANSLVGSSASDEVGSDFVTTLANGNYLVTSRNWDNGAATNAGAVTWGSGTTGVAGVVSASNSLVGSTTDDRVGSGGLTLLTNGNYVVRTSGWDNGAATNAGAVTWGSGTTGVAGVVSASNSLVGSTTGDQVGSGGLTALTNGNYVVTSANWDNGAAIDAGAVTWVSGTASVAAAVSTANSLVGSTANDFVGNFGVTTLTNGNYVVTSANWDNGAAIDAGAVTWMSGANGATLTGSISGAVSTVNSIVGIEWNGPVVDTVNGSFLVRRPTLGGAVYVNLLTPLPSGMNFAANPASSANMSPAFVATPLRAGTATTLQANNDITLSIPLTVNNPSGNGGALTLQAGRSVTFNANLTTDGGALNVLANADTSAGVVSAQRDTGAGGVNIPAGIVIDAGSGAVSLATGTAAGLTNRTSGGVTVSGTVSAGSVSIATADSGSGTPSVTVNGTLNLAGPLTIQSDGPVNFGAASVVTGVTGVAITTSNDPVSFAGAFAASGNQQIIAGTGLVSFADDWAVGSGTGFVSSTQAVTVADVLSLNGGMLLATAGLSIGGSGTVRGSGNIVSPIALGASVTIAPGAGGLATGSGTLNFGQSLNLPATATVAMNGTSKTAFDKVAAIGVNLAGATLALDLSAATLVAGDAITLVDNISAAATAGTFAGLAQGAIFTANGHTMQISYTGGDGNDVVVTRIGDITASFSVTRSGFLYLVPTDTYRQVITMTNTTPTARRPRTFKFVGLPGEVSIVGGTQSGADWFLNLGDASVPSAGSLGIPVQFVVPSGNSFTYTLEILGG